MRNKIIVIIATLLGLTAAPSGSTANPVLESGSLQGISATVFHAVANGSARALEQVIVAVF